MVLHDYLFESSGLLSMGEAAERRYGRKNFLEFYAVFSSPQYYRVVGPSGADIGSLEQGFVDNLVEQMTSFLLGGRAWLVEAIDHKQRTVAADRRSHTAVPVQQVPGGAPATVRARAGRPLPARSRRCAALRRR